MLVGRRFCVVLVGVFALLPAARGQESGRADLEGRYTRSIQPLLNSHCVSCHGEGEPEAKLDLRRQAGLDELLNDADRLGKLVDRLVAGEMPPEDAKTRPTDEERRAAVAWLRDVRAFGIRSHAGDPGPVLVRRLSNSEYNYAIRDLTGVDIRPTREFPVDPTNTAGFDNSGESLVMSPTLLDKYLKAAREVASHMYLKEFGFGFAPHPMLALTDREKFSIQSIIGVYFSQNTDYAKYFEGAWRYKHRAALGTPDVTLPEIARELKVSPKYLATIWSLLEEDAESVGPLLKLREMWRALPAPGVTPEDLRTACVAMRSYVIGVRRKVEVRILNINAGEVGTEWLPFLYWKNEQYARHRRDYDRSQLQIDGKLTAPSTPARVEGGNRFGPGQTPLIENKPGDPDLFVPADQREQYEAAFARFCSVFPDYFYVEERGRNYFNTGRDEGRYLSAGYHNVMGYFRDDWPLYELLLDEQQQAQLDEMWRQLDFISSASNRSHVEFTLNGTRGARESFNDNEPALTLVAQLDDVDIVSTPLIRQLEAAYLARVLNNEPVAVGAIKQYFKMVDDTARWVERARVAAEPSHVEALLAFAARAWRKPLSAEERDGLIEFYRSAREVSKLDHETAMRESIVMVLMAPEFTYRLDLLETGSGVQPLTDSELASRLSFFLWSSLPDEELLARAAAGDLHNPDVLIAQTRRMLQDPRARALAVEWGANWLDFRRFEEISSVDRQRFPAFTDELRQAMFEEPVRFLLDVIQNNRPAPDLLFATDTFVNPVLAKHYGIPYPESAGNQWVKVPDANRYDRGGLLPMAAFLTKNAPGLRTSPVKRGYWVAKNVLGDHIPPPPAAVPELPTDESKLDLPLRDMLARHRADPACSSCHDRFDALGLVFEKYGPVGDLRLKDLAGREVDAGATFPNGDEGEGLAGVQNYIRQHRQDEFLDNLCGKLVAFALGRSLILSDEGLVDDMRSHLAAHELRIQGAIETLVTSRQFLTKRGGEQLAARESAP